VKPEWRFVSCTSFCAVRTVLERTVLERTVLERTDRELRAAHRVATYPQITLEIPVRWTANVKSLSFLPAARVAFKRQRLNHHTGKGAARARSKEWAHGHDAWIIGNEPCVVIDWQGFVDYAEG